jgi:hypothetical protein
MPSIFCVIRYPDRTGITTMGASLFEAAANALPSEYLGSDHLLRVGSSAAVAGVIPQLSIQRKRQELRSRREHVDGRRRRQQVIIPIAGRVGCARIVALVVVELDVSIGVRGAARRLDGARCDGRTYNIDSKNSLQKLPASTRLEFFQ